MSTHKKLVVEDFHDDNNIIEFYSTDEARTFINEIFWEDNSFEAFDMTWKAVKECLEACEYLIISDDF